MTVTPLSAELSASGLNSKTTLKVFNDSAAPIPVEVSSSKLTVAEDGTFTNVPVKGKFLVFPPQATIPPGASQSFRVQWMGDQNLKASESYTLSVNQLPVDLGQKKNGVQIVFNFSVIVNVAGVNAKPVISVLKADIAQTSSKGKEPVITLENSGTGHALLGDGSLILTSGSWSKTFAGDEIRKLFGMGLIQPGTKRRFSLATQLPPEVSRYDVRIDLKRPR
jgi:fimbrial chaperone protein